MATQKVVICKALRDELQAFLSALSYDKLFILTDENTYRQCLPLLAGVAALQEAPVIQTAAGDTHKGLEYLAKI